MDRFGLEMILPTAQRVETIAELCRSGYGKQMVLSHDACCHIDFYADPSMRSLVPLWNFRHIPDDVVPALRKAGVSEEDIRAMPVEHPRRARKPVTVAARTMLSTMRSTRRRTCGVS